MAEEEEIRKILRRAALESEFEDFLYNLMKAKEYAETCNLTWALDYIEKAGGVSTTISEKVEIPAYISAENVDKVRRFLAKKLSETRTEIVKVLREKCGCK
jgi:hypothetical protein